MPIQWHELSSEPPLSGLYGKAALHRKITGKVLPETGLRCRVNVDTERLVNYRKICLFGESSLLPPTYPHVMAFALQMKLLTEDGFPFPLLGLVHLHNRIRVLRPLGGLSSVRISVHVENLLPHDKGATFDMITQVDDGLGPLWEETSTLLCRGAQVPGEVPAQVLPAELPLVEARRWYAGNEAGRRYARVSGDYNPIHLSATTARLFGFPQAIAHGMWLKAMTMAALREHWPMAGYEIAVQFHKPVRLPSEVVLLASSAKPSGQLRLEGHGELVHMTGSWAPVT
ncbi:MaoC family dehydratase [Pseudomonas akapageensis]|uniref:MaoC family dehydratase n=1 Tax=Pseudomonas akapageensis TaxID=2609961 RepID=UPI00140CFD80|nr:MaoC family dehydratase [Pseudomonas akapageensis]